MKHTTPQLRRATGLLLAAAALPLTPLFAQDAATQAPADAQTAQPAPDPTPPASESRPAEPVTVDPTPAPDTTAEPAADPAEATPPAPVRRTAPRAATRTTTIRSVRTEAPAAAAPLEALPPLAAPPPIAATPIPEGTIAAPLPVEELPAPVTTAPVDTVAPVATRTERDPSSIVLWVIGAVLLGALAYFLLRRRRRDDAVVHHETYDETALAGPVARVAEPVREPARAAPVARAAEPAPVRPVPVQPVRAQPAPVRAAPAAVSPGVIAPLVTGAAVGGTIPAFRSFAAEEPAAAPAAAAPAAAAAVPLETGEPRLDLLMHPVRAGVTGEEARVEFQLAVENQGSAPARDVRISTWLFAAGGDRGSELERMLIDRGAADAEELPQITIEAGAGQRIETAATLPTAGIHEDAVLPVVVAEARYRLPDGSEGRTSARFAVGVLDGEELAHFAIENPSGLHEGVVARELGDPERA